MKNYLKVFTHCLLHRLRLNKNHSMRTITFDKSVDIPKTMPRKWRYCTCGYGRDRMNGIIKFSEDMVKKYFKVNKDEVL